MMLTLMVGSLGIVFLMGYDFRRSFEAFLLIWDQFETPFYILLSMMILSTTALLSYIFWQDIYLSTIDLLNFQIDVTNWIISTSQSLIGWNFFVIGSLFEFVCNTQHELAEFSVNNAQSSQMDLIESNIDYFGLVGDEIDQTG